MIVDSFLDWCSRNNAEEYLIRWDTQLNGKLPSEVSAHSNSKWWFRCAKCKDHPPIQLCLNNITNRFKGEFKKCPTCDSFGQWCLDHDRNDLLCAWDEELNQESPFEVNKGLTK